jgi:tetratricopeptide (TPR) repeat protein
MTYRFAICLLLSAFIGSTVAAQEGGYSSYREAMAAGVTLYNGGKLAESRKPLEAAAKLAAKDSDKCRIHQILVIVYAEGGDFPPMYESAEFVIEHAPYPAMASLTCQSLLGLAHKKGQQDAARKRYEERLKKNPHDRTSMYVLSIYHGRLDRDFAKQAEYLKLLVDLDKAEGKELNVDTAGKLAFSYRLAKKYVESAELFEKIAPLNKDEEAWNHKEAAGSWLKAGQKNKALTAAKKADSMGPAARAEKSLDRWHSELGEVFLAAGEGTLAVKHYELAIEKASAEFYKKQFAEELEKAKKL